MAETSVIVQESDVGCEVEESVAQPKAKKRLESLDALRGLTVVLMITANYQSEEPFPQIEHAEWAGFTIADAIFPTFVFVMGLAIPLALGSATATWRTFLRMFKRSAILWGIGAFLNGFPFTRAASGYRFTGVLQRLGLCYLVLASVFVLPHNKIYLRFVFPISSLLLWLLVTYLVDVPGCGRGQLTPECSAEGLIDTWAWGQSHNYQGAEYDPEGILSTVTSLITCWLGLMVGMHIRNVRHRLCDAPSRFRKVAQLLLAGQALMFLAYAIQNFIPIIKNLWTPTFVLLAGGVSLCLLGLLMYLIDILNLLHSPSKPTRIIFRSLMKVGANPLLIYSLSGFLAITLSAIKVSINGEPSSIGLLIYTYLLASWLPNNLSSLILSQIFVWLLFVPLAWFLDSKGWYLKA